MMRWIPEQLAAEKMLIHQFTHRDILQLLSLLSLAISQCNIISKIYFSTIRVRCFHSVEESYNDTTYIHDTHSVLIIKWLTFVPWCWPNVAPGCYHELTRIQEGWGTGQWSRCCRANANQQYHVIRSCIAMKCWIWIGSKWLGGCSWNVWQGSYHFHVTNHLIITSR